jgi:hypothetical protein
MGRKKLLLAGVDGCRVCAGWGPVTRDGRCPRCRTWDKLGAGRVTAVCRRCGHLTRVDFGRVCRPCLVEIRHGDDEWVLAGHARRELPRRDLQLALVLPDVDLGHLEPLNKRRGAKLRLLPRTWRLQHPLEPLPDDPAVCPPQLPGQLTLLRVPRQWTAAHAGRIRGRVVRDGELVETTARRVQKELGHTSAWRRALMPLARLALAGRDADEDQIREEDLDGLAGQRGPVLLVLREAGLLRDRCDPRPPAPRKQSIGPRRKRRPNVSGYRPMPPPPRPVCSCSQCLAWTGTGRVICDPCRSFATRTECAPGVCGRCGRMLPVVVGRCRLCTVAVAAGSPTAIVQDQLWLLNVALRPSPTAATTEPVGLSEHLVGRGQQALFAAPPRSWATLLDRSLPALTPAARNLIEVFDRRARDEHWSKGTRLANTRVLRIALAHLGADAPITEADLRALARLRSSFAGLRVAQFLDARGLLIPAADRDIGMDEAAVARLAAGAPASFRADVDVWIRVLRGQGRRPSRALSWTTVRRYLGYVLPVLAGWSATFTSLRQVSAEDVVATIEARPGAPGRSVHSGLRSMFRALKRERVIFHDPARTVRLGGRTGVPRPVPTDRIAGLLDTVPTAFGRLCVALVAIHAVRPMMLPGLLLADLDRAHGRLRAGDRVVYLDELTSELISDWIGERHRRWPHSSNPYLLVSRRTAMHADNPPIVRFAVRYQFRFTGLNPQRIWTDRILDEARDTADPIHLMRVFGLSATTAVKYVQAAHPDRCTTDPIPP